MQRELEVALKAKVPRLKCDTKQSFATIRVTVTGTNSESNIAAGFVSLEVNRGVTVHATGEAAMVDVYSRGVVYLSNSSSERREIADSVNELVTIFAKDYYDAGNE